MLHRAALTIALLLALSGTARADLAPEPWEPASPTFWIVLALAVAAAAFVIYRRRRK